MSERIDFTLHIPAGKLFAKPRQATSPSASTPAPTLPETLANIPKRKSANIPPQHEGRASSPSVADQPRGRELVNEIARAHASGRTMRNYVCLNGELTIRGEQFLARSQGKTFSPALPHILELWIDKDNRLSMKDFLKLHNLYSHSFTHLATSDHTLTPFGEDVVARAHGHRFVARTRAHIEDFQKLCIENGGNGAIVAYCRKMNLSVRSVREMVSDTGALTRAGERYMASSDRDVGHVSTSTVERHNSIKRARTEALYEQGVSTLAESLKREVSQLGSHEDPDVELNDDLWMTINDGQTEADEWANSLLGCGGAASNESDFPAK